MGVARGALLAEAAGGLLAEHGVLGSQAGDLGACGVQAGAERLGGGSLGGGTRWKAPPFPDCGNCVF